MIAWLNERLRTICFYWHFLPVLWKHARRGLYVYRNAPTWVVEEIVDNPPPQGFTHQYDINDLYNQAVDELHLRISRSGVAA